MENQNEIDINPLKYFNSTLQRFYTWVKIYYGTKRTNIRAGGSENEWMVRGIQIEVSRECTTKQVGGSVLIKTAGY